MSFKLEHVNMLSISGFEIMIRCLTWCRTGTNNKTLQLYATTFEQFHNASGKLMDKIRTVLPEGSTQCRIRFSKRESHTPTVSTLKETLGEESEGMVFLDPQGIPIKYDMLQIYKDAIASTACRIAVDISGERN